MRRCARGRDEERRQGRGKGDKGGRWKVVRRGRVEGKTKKGEWGEEQEKGWNRGWERKVRGMKRGKEGRREGRGVEKGR